MQKQYDNKIVQAAKSNSVCTGKEPIGGKGRRTVYRKAKTIIHTINPTL